MTDLNTTNGKIRSTFLGVEDHGILTFFIHLEWDGAGQGLGGFAIDGPDKENGGRLGFGPGLVAIRRILETVGVDSWEKLPGQLVRVRHEGWGSHRPPIIGHIMEDRWFDLREFMEAQA